MTRATVVLIQKPDSPYRQLLEATLDQEYGAQGWYCFADTPVGMLPGAPWVALWDLHGQSPVEVQALAAILAPEEVGVVLICGQVDEMVKDALRAINALALLADPKLPREVAAALEVAEAIHQRLADLAAQRQELEQELEDRQVVEKAKRVLMETRGYSEAEAMRALQKHSRDTNQKLVAVARKVLQAVQVFNGQGTGD
jgi:response regulator NasT